MSAIKKVEKVGGIFYHCESCDYYAKRFDVMQKHILTQKHIGNQSAIKSWKKVEQVALRIFCVLIAIKVIYQIMD